MKEQAELVGGKTVAGRAIGSEVQLMFLNSQFHCIPCTVAFSVQFFYPELVPERVVAFYRFAVLLKFPLCILDGYIGQLMQLTVSTQSGNIFGFIQRSFPDGSW